MSLPPRIPPRRDAVTTPDSRAATVDEDYLLALLAANDGILWQSEIVDALDISKATISRRPPPSRTTRRSTDSPSAARKSSHWTTKPSRQ